MEKSDDCIIYRYMSYCEFLDIIRFNRLTFRYPGKWPDRLEALFLKAFEDGNEIDKLADAYSQHYPNYPVCDIKSDFQILSSLLIKTRCQCWTYKEDDLVMWNERNSAETVRIGVSVNCFDKYDSVSDGGRLIHRDIEYSPNVTYETLLASFARDRKIPHFVLTKKSVFEYEDEHRLVLLPTNHSFSTPAYGDTLSEYLLRHFYGTKSEFGLFDKQFYFDIGDIIDVKVNPNATDCFAEFVQKDCELFGLNYTGKSQILE